MNILKPQLKFNIIGAARALPNETPISNLEILQNHPKTANKSAKFHQKMDEKIQENFGYVQRYWSHKPWESLDDTKVDTETLSIEVAKQVFSQQDPKKLEAYLLGSTTNRRYTGSQAAAVLGKFGIRAAAYDLKTGCSTSLSTLNLGYALLNLGYSNVLIGAVETLSKVSDPDNERTWFGVGDGAAAVWLEKNDKGHFTVEKSVFTTDGSHADLYTTPASLPPTHKRIDENGYSLKGDEMLLKDLAVERYMQMLSNMLPTPAERSEITWIIPHQVNRKIVDFLIEKFQLNNATLLWDGDKVGNLGGTSIIFTLARAIEENLFDRNGKILMMSVGGGLSYASQVIDFKR